MSDKIDKIAEGAAAWVEAEMSRLRAELTDACAAHDVLSKALTGANELNKEWRDLIERRDAELAQVRTELKDLQGANRALVQQVADVTSNREYWYKEYLSAEAKLAGTRAQETAIKEAVERRWGFWYGNTLVARPSGYEEEIGAAWNKLLAASNSFSKSRDCHPRIHENLTKADLAAHIKELGDLLEKAESAAHIMHQSLDTERQLRQEAEAELADARADLKLNVKMLADQCDQAREAENERDKWRRKAQEQSDEAHCGWLSPEDTKGAQRRIDVLEARRDHWLRKHCESERKTGGLKKQLAEMEAGRDYWRKRCKHNIKTLGDAEAALADCGTSGVFAEFDGLADAIQQMGEHIKNLTAKLTDARLAAHIREPSEALERQSVHTERQLRQEAERRVAQVMAQNRSIRLEQAGHHVKSVEQRAERAEALAALVTLELANLLDFFGDIIQPELSQRTAERAHALAAQIREVLDDNQA